MNDETVDVMANLRRSLKEIGDAFGLAAYTWSRRGGKGSNRETWYRDGARSACSLVLRELDAQPDVGAIVAYLHVRQSTLSDVLRLTSKRRPRDRYLYRGAYDTYYLIENAIANYDGDVRAAHLKRREVPV